MSRGAGHMLAAEASCAIEDRSGYDEGGEPGQDASPACAKMEDSR
jgi:hypothetical protein